MMNEDLKTQLKYLRLNGLLSNWDAFLKLAAKNNFSHAHLLSHVIQEEYLLKQQNARKLRLQRANLPEELLLETYPFDRQPKLNKKKIFALYDTQSYFTLNQNIIWLGKTGCGKTGLATGFVLRAIDQGHSARYVLFAELIHQFYQSAADHSEELLLKKYLSFDLLFIDEIGYVEAEPAQVGLFFTLLQKRHKKKSTLITSNLGFGEWGTFLKNDHLTAALIDRLTENSHVFNMKQCVGLRGNLDDDTPVP